MRKVLERCPTCGGDLEVTRLTCPTCQTAIESRYTLCPFCKLGPESLQFLEIFVKCKGNIKEMERELKLPYTTIRNRVNSVIRELGYEVEAEEESPLEVKRREILRRLENGEIKASEAAQMLAELKNAEEI